MRRYKFKTAEDAIELCRSLGKNNGMKVLTKSNYEVAKQMRDSLQCVVVPESYYSTFVCYGIYHRSVLSCLFYTQNHHIKTHSSFILLFRHTHSAHCSHHEKRR